MISSKIFIGVDDEQDAHRRSAPDERDDVARGVFRAALPKHRPRSHIAPADIGGNHAGLLCPLHHRVIDRVGAAGLAEITSQRG